MPPVKNRTDMIAQMSPVLRDGRFVFVTSSDVDVQHQLDPHALGRFGESEGVSYLLSIDAARQAGLPAQPLPVAYQG